MLTSMNLAYPYHQVIGFYMERAGFAGDEIERFRRLGLKFDFYLAHAIIEKNFDQRWRVYFPKNLTLPEI